MKEKRRKKEVEQSLEGDRRIEYDIRWRFLGADCVEFV